MALTWWLVTTHRWTLKAPIKTFNETRRGPPQSRVARDGRSALEPLTCMAPELKQLRLIFFFFPLILNRFSERLFRNRDPVWKNRLPKRKV